MPDGDANDLILSPDEWFQNALAHDPEGFAELLDDTDFHSRFKFDHPEGPTPDLNDLLNIARAFPAEVWQTFTDRQKRYLQRNYFRAQLDSLGRAPDRPVPPATPPPPPTPPTATSPATPDVEFVIGYGLESAIEWLEGHSDPDVPEGELPGEEPTFEFLEDAEEAAPATDAPSDDSAKLDRSKRENSVPGSRAAERDTDGIDHSKLAGAQRFITEDGAAAAELMRELDGDDDSGAPRSFTDSYPGPSVPQTWVGSDSENREADGGSTADELPAPERLYRAPGGIHEPVAAPADEARAAEAQELWERAQQASDAESSGGVVIGAGGGINILGIPISTRLIAIVAAAAVFAVIAVVALSGGGGDSEVPASSGGSTGGGAASTAAAGGAATSGAATTVAANSCQVAHDQQLIVDLASPGDVQPAIPLRYTRGEASENGFPTPYLEWSELPSETTEIAILVQRLTRARGVEYAADSRLWWNANPSGIAVWKVTGLDPLLQALPASEVANPLPSGAVERPHENGRLTLGEDVYEQKLWINTGEPHLFTVFALCDPPLAGTADDYNQPWLIRNAVAVGWFISSLDQ